MNENSTLHVALWLKRTTLALLFTVLFWNFSFATNYYAAANGNWNVASTWSLSEGGAGGAGIPTASDNVTISKTFTVTVDNTAPAFCATLQIGSVISGNGLGKLTFTSGSSLTVSSSITIGSTGGSSNSGTITMTTGGALTCGALSFGSDFISNAITQGSGSTITVGGNATLSEPPTLAIGQTNAWNINAGTATVSGAVLFPTTGSFNGTVAKIVITSGTLNANGGMSFSSGAVSNTAKIIDMSGGAGTLNLKGALGTPSNANLIAGTAGSVFNYADDAASQTVSFFGTNLSNTSNYYNLYINNTSTNGAKLSAAVTTSNVKGSIEVQTGTFDNGGFAIAGNAGKNFKVLNGATFILSGTTSAMATGFAKTFQPTSNVIYKGTGAQVISGETYGNLATANGGATAKTINNNTTVVVNGTLTVNSGSTLDMPNSNINLTVSGLTTISGTIKFGNAAGTKSFGDVTVTNTGTWSETAAATPSFSGNLQNDGTFTGQNGVHTFTGAGKTFSGTNTISIPKTTVTGSYTNNGILKVGTDLAGTGSLTQGAGANVLLQLGGTTTINSLTTTATGNTVEYYGAAAQTITKTNSFYNLKINNAAGVLLSQATSVAGALTLNSGKLTTSSGNLLTLLDDATATSNASTSFVNGPMQKIGDDTFSFPVGKTAIVPIGISAPANTTDAFTAEYFPLSGTALGPISTSARNNGLEAVSNKEYWVLDRSNGSSAVDVTLTWSANNAGSGASYISNPFVLVVAHFSGTTTPGSGEWDDYGPKTPPTDGQVTGSSSNGSVTWKNVSTFSPFTLGTIDAAQAPLPLTFTAFEGRKVATGTQLSWKVAGESHTTGFEVLRRYANGSFSTIGVVAATGSGSYSFTDAAAQSGVMQYRLHTVSGNGQSAYSTILTFQNGKGAILFQVLPTLVHNSATVQHSAAGAGALLSLTTADGKQVKLKKPQAGSIQTEVNMTGLRPGIYLLRFNDGSGTVQTVKLLKQ